MKRTIEAATTQDGIKKYRKCDGDAIGLNDYSQDIGSPKKIIKDASHICQLCSQLYTDPRMLSCLHSFCQECLHREMEKLCVQQKHKVKLPQLGAMKTPDIPLGKGKVPALGMNCPTCKTHVTIPIGGVGDLPQDLHLGIEAKIAHYQSKVVNKNILPCDVCVDSTSSGPAVVFCCSCQHFLCQLCCDHHKRARNFCQHDVVVLGEVVSREQFAAVKPFCALHSKEFVLYCEMCSCLICHECIITEHKDHIQNAKLPSTVATSHRNDIRQLLPSAHEVVLKLTDAVNGNVIVLKELEENEEAVSLSIKQTFLQLHQALDDRMNKLLTDLHDMAIYKTTALMLQKEKFETLKQDISYCVEFASSVLQKYTDCEIIALKQIPSAELQVSMRKTQSVPLKPCECSGMKLALKTNLFQTCLSDICHINNVYPGKSTWNSTSEYVTKGSPYVLTVYAKDFNGEEYPYDDIQLGVELKPIGVGSAAVLGKVVQRRNGRYSISLTPVSSGLHLLTITMNNQSIQNIPKILMLKQLQ